MRVRYLKVSDSKMFHLSSYPNFSASGSVVGMKRDSYGKDAMLVRCGKYIYNVPSSIYYSAK